MSEPREQERVAKFIPHKHHRCQSPFFVAGSLSNTALPVWSQTEERMMYPSSAILCQGACPALCFSFICPLGPAIPSPGTALRLRQGVYPNTSSFCFTGDQGLASTWTAGSVLRFSSESQTLLEMCRCGKWISYPLHVLPHDALLWSMGLPKHQLSFEFAEYLPKYFNS